jgi:hypothetical protein
VANSEENLRAVLAALEQCQASLILNGEGDTAQLVSIAILELRIKLGRVEDLEFKALCDLMVSEGEEAGRTVQPKLQAGLRPRSPVALRLVK